MRDDPLSSFVIRPFLLAFIGNLLAAFTLLNVASDHEWSGRTFSMIVPPELMTMTATIEWLVLASCLHLLRRFPRPPSHGMHTHTPHPPM